MHKSLTMVYVAVMQAVHVLVIRLLFFFTLLRRVCPEGKLFDHPLHLYQKGGDWSSWQEIHWAGFCHPFVECLQIAQDRTDAEPRPTCNVIC